MEFEAIVAANYPPSAGRVDRRPPAVGRPHRPTRMACGRGATACPGALPAPRVRTSPRRTRRRSPDSRRPDRRRLASDRRRTGRARTSPRSSGDDRATGRCPPSDATSVRSPGHAAAVCDTTSRTDLTCITRRHGRPARRPAQGRSAGRVATSHAYRQSAIARNRSRSARICARRRTGQVARRPQVHDHVPVVRLDPDRPQQQSAALRCARHPEVRHELLDLHRRTRSAVGSNNALAFPAIQHTAAAVSLGLSPASEDLRVARRGVGEQAAAGRPVLVVEQLRTAALHEIEHLADPRRARRPEPRPRRTARPAAGRRPACRGPSPRRPPRGALSSMISATTASRRPRRRRRRPRRPRRRTRPWPPAAPRAPAAGPSGSAAGTPARTRRPRRSVSSVSPGRMPRSWWQNRMNARSSSGARVRCSTSATILRGIQSSSRISAATGLQRIGSPGP